MGWMRLDGMAYGNKQIDKRPRQTQTDKQTNKRRNEMKIHDMQSDDEVGGPKTNGTRAKGEE